MVFWAPAQPVSASNCVPKLFEIDFKSFWALTPRCNPAFIQNLSLSSYSTTSSKIKSTFFQTFRKNKCNNFFFIRLWGLKKFISDYWPTQGNIEYNFKRLLSCVPKQYCIIRMWKYVLIILLRMTRVFRMVVFKCFWPRPRNVKSTQYENVICCKPDLL